MDSSRRRPRLDDNNNGVETRMKTDLTEDLIVDILARLPVKTLVRFRCVSKFWNKLIFSPNFISMHTSHSHHHCNTNKNVSLWLYNRDYDSTHITLYFQFGEDLVKKLKFDDHMCMSHLYSPMSVTRHVPIVGCFNGVVCLSISPCPQTYALWNPATRQVSQIGRALMDDPSVWDPSYLDNGGLYGSGFCFNPVTRAFKIAQVKLTGTDEAARAQVNVFYAATNSWIAKYMVVPYPIRGSCHYRIRESNLNFIHGATCVVNGYMHWHVDIYHPDSASRNDMYILSYDMIKEVFKRIEMPFPRPINGFIRLAGYKGSLAIFVHRLNGSYAEIDVWVMDECGGSSQSWSNILILKPSIEVTRAIGFFIKDGVDCILFYSEPNKSLYVYDPVNSETKKFWKRGSIPETFVYSETLASVY